MYIYICPMRKKIPPSPSLPLFVSCPMRRKIHPSLSIPRFVSHHFLHHWRLLRRAGRHQHQMSWHWDCCTKWADIVTLGCTGIAAHFIFAGTCAQNYPKKKGILPAFEVNCVNLYRLIYINVSYTLTEIEFFTSNMICILRESWFELTWISLKLTSIWYWYRQRPFQRQIPVTYLNPYFLRQLTRNRGVNLHEIEVRSKGGNSGLGWLRLLIPPLTPTTTDQQ